MRVFVSHCLKIGDSLEYSAWKLKLIEALERRGHSVYDYVERPIYQRNWAEEVKLQLQYCDCVVYFAKRWPEPEPGVCAMELAAAQVLGKPILIFSPQNSSSPHSPFLSEGFSGISKALHHPANRVFKSEEDLCKTLQTLPVSRESQRERAFRVLEQSLLEHTSASHDFRQVVSLLDCLQIASKSEEDGGLALQLMRVTDSQSDVLGYFVIPDSSTVLAIRSDHSGKTRVCPFQYNNTTWNSKGEYLLDEDVPQTLDKIYTAGIVHDTPYLLLVDQQNVTCFVGKDKTTSIDPNLQKRSRRTVIQQLDLDGHKCIGFYADGVVYTIEANGHVEEQSKQARNIPPDFLVPSQAQSKASLKAIYGMQDRLVYSAGGRVDAVQQLPADAAIGAIAWKDNELRLGYWQSIDSEKLWKTVLVDPQGFIPEHLFNDSNYSDDAPREVSGLLEDFGLIKCYYWQAAENQPAVILRDCDSNHRIIDRHDWKPGYHCLSFAWTDRLLQSVCDFLSGR